MLQSSQKVCNAIPTFLVFTGSAAGRARRDFAGGVLVAPSRQGASGGWPVKSCVTLQLYELLVNSPKCVCP